MRGVGWLNYDIFPAWLKWEVGKIIEKVFSFPSSGNNGNFFCFKRTTELNMKSYSKMHK